MTLIIVLALAAYAFVFFLAAVYEIRAAIIEIRDRLPKPSVDERERETLPTPEPVPIERRPEPIIASTGILQHMCPLCGNVSDKTFCHGCDRNSDSHMHCRCIDCKHQWLGEPLRTA